MEKEHDDLYYMELKDLISTRQKPNEEQSTFVKSYLYKLGIDIEQDQLLVISPLDSRMMGFLILDIISDFKKLQKVKH